MVGEKTVPKGYKRTEVGVLPEEWEVKPLGAVANIYRGASPRPSMIINGLLLMVKLGGIGYQMLQGLLNS